MDIWPIKRSDWWRSFPIMKETTGLMFVMDYWRISMRMNVKENSMRVWRIPPNPPVNQKLSKRNMRSLKPLHACRARSWDDMPRACLRILIDSWLSTCILIASIVVRASTPIPRWAQLAFIINATSALRRTVRSICANIVFIPYVLLPLLSMPSPSLIVPLITFTQWIAILFPSHLTILQSYRTNLSINVQIFWSIVKGISCNLIRWNIRFSLLPSCWIASSISQRIFTLILAMVVSASYITSNIYVSTAIITNYVKIV